MPELFDVNTNRQGLIVYGSVDSSNYGIVVGEPPAFERPVRKQTVYQIPGRNGAVLFQEDAWNDVQRNYKVWLAEDANDTLVEKVDAFEAAINAQKGYTRLEDNFEPDIYRLAYYSGGDGFTDNLTQYGEATLNFTCRPERFLKAGETAVTVTNGSVLTNPTRYVSKPLIHIEVVRQAQSQLVKVTINGKTINANVYDYLNIDCERMDAYRLAAENRNSMISGAFPTIAPGNNAVTITGNAYLITITPRYFTI